MSGLKERLLRLKRAETGGAAAGRPAAAGEEPAQAGSGADAGLEAEQERVRTEWSCIGGMRLERNGSGAFLLRESVYGSGCRHGDMALHELAGLAGELGALCGATGDASAPEVEKLLFFDTETTGLGVGAGNVPFMIGVGFYRGDEFVVQQLFIRNMAEEAAMLAYLRELLLRYTHIVSYNGRTFDWPIVKSRYVLNRSRLDEDEWRQLDLLFPARSLWKTVLDSCRLSSVETHRLGFCRKDDVPGSLAPVLYAQYLAERDPRAVAGVFVHNEHDIVSLAALTVRLAQLLRGDAALAELGGEELLRLGAWLDKLGRRREAERARAELAARLLGGGALPARDDRLLLELASAYKKRAQHERAAELWLRCVELRGGSFACPIEPYIELAMYYEHRARRLDEALRYAEEAQNMAWRRASLARMGDRQREVIEALQKRLARLRAKQRRGTAARGAEQAQAAGGARQQSAAAGELGARQTAPALLSAKPPRAKRSKPEYARESLFL